MGVVGVSTIQALAFGVGFIFIDLPGATFLSLAYVIFMAWVDDDEDVALNDKTVEV